MFALEVLEFQSSASSSVDRALVFGTRGRGFESCLACQVSTTKERSVLSGNFRRTGSERMRAYILSIGSELLEGHLTDTNATYLAQELAALGIELLHVIQVGDNRRRIVGALRLGLQDAGLVICTGGVGPTEDDLTREAIAEVADETPEISPDLLKEIESFFAARNLVMPARNAKQAWLIPSVEALANPVGTAPGWFATIDERIIVAMPGVPREMKRMWTEQVVPRLTTRMHDRVYRSTTLKTIGIGESALEDRLSDLVAKENPVVATYAKDDGVHIRVTGYGDTEAEALSVRGLAVDQVMELIGGFVYGDEQVMLPEALLSMLRQNGLQIAVRDLGGGGRFGSLLLESPHAADVVIESIAIPSPDVEVGKSAAQKTGRDDRQLLQMDVQVEAREAPPVYEGSVRVILGGPRSADETFPMRATYAEIQRRSALHAADVLFRVLR
jgi:nicotinamide-nucleotide amidase